MSDYIKTKEYKFPDGETVTAYFDEYGIAKITIQALDAIFDNFINSADRIEVVRCKDCVYREVKGEGMTHWFGCRIMEHNDDDWYCSFGERAERSVEWHLEHKRLGFYDPIAELYETMNETGDIHEQIH